MTTTRRILIGTIVAMVVIAAGFAAGLGFHEKRHIFKNAAPQKQPAESAVNANTATYEISPPSLGLMLDTYAVNIASEGPFARIEVPGADGEKIKTGQKVFLFDQNGEMLDSMATVMGIMPSDNVTFVEIDLRNNPDVPPSAIARGKIIVGRNLDAFRLPYSALARNEKGETFVWEVTGDVNGESVAKFKPIEIKSGNDTVFSIQPDQRSSNLFILNPDANLRDGQKVNVRKFLYTPPSPYEDARIESIVESRIRQIRDQQELFALDLLPPSPAGEQSQTPSSSCAQSGNAAQDFIDKIKAMSEMPQTSVTSP